MIKFIFNNLGLLFLSLLAAVLYFLCMTTPGLQVDLMLAQKFMPGTLSVSSASGKLFSAFTLENITYQDRTLTANIKRLSLVWQPLGLLSNHLIINTANIDQAEFNLQNPGSSSSVDLSTFKFLPSITIQHLAIHQLTLHNQDAMIYLNGTLDTHWQMQWNVAVPHLTVFDKQISGALFTSGKITGSLFNPTLTAVLRGNKLNIGDLQIGNLNGQANIIAQPNIDSTLSINASQLKFKNYHSTKFNFALNGNIHRDKNSLHANLTALLQNQYRIHAAFLFPRFSGLNDFQQPMSGNLSTTLTNLNFLSDFIPQIKNPSGTLQANVKLLGKVAAPQITLNANLTHGKFSLPFLGIAPNNINLQASTDRNLQINFSGTFQSGSGNGQLKGILDAKQPNFPVSLTLEGQQLQAINLSEYHVTISPTLTLQYVNNNLNLQGTILIPSADITPKNFSSTVTLPSDVIFVNNHSAQPALPFTTSLQLNLKLGEHIHIAYDDLTTELGGNVQISEIPGGLINATGELYAMNGTYVAYGQTLTIQNGRLIYTGGSLMNPGLNIAAVKQVKTINLSGNTNMFSNTTLQPVYTGSEMITVGVQVTGTLNNPVYNLISTPALSQGDILSYLILGYPQSSASGQQTGAILSAIAALSPNGPSINGLSKKIEQQFGINEINVQSTQVFNPTTNSTVSTTTFGIGKQLAEKLYIHYSVGLFYPVSILNLRYQINKHWAVQSETSTVDNGADLLYGIERD